MFLNFVTVLNEFMFNNLGLRSIISGISASTSSDCKALFIPCWQLNTRILTFLNWICSWTIINPVNCWWSSLLHCCRKIDIFGRETLKAWLTASHFWVSENSFICSTAATLTFIFSISRSKCLSLSFMFRLKSLLEAKNIERVHQLLVTPALQKVEWLEYLEQSPSLQTSVDSKIFGKILRKEFMSPAKSIISSFKTRLHLALISWLNTFCCSLRCSRVLPGNISRLKSAWLHFLNWDWPIWVGSAKRCTFHVGWKYIIA